MKVLLADLHKFIGYSGGIENVFAKMAKALSERGYDVVGVFADEKKEGDFFFSIPREVKLYNLYHIPGQPEVTPSKVRKVLREIIRPLSRAAARNQNYQLLYQARNQMQYVLDTEKPDVIISFREPTGRLLLDGLGTKIPVISMLHSSPDEIFYGMPKEEKQALTKSARIQVLMPSFVESAKKYIQYDQFVVIPNAVNLPDITADVGGDKKVHTITCVGRLTGRTKRQHLLIEAFGKLAKDFPDWQVELWGDTYDKPYVAALKAQVKKEHLEGRVHFCGTTKDLTPVWEKTDIFAFPSHHEGFGMALIEAMGAGIPAVGFKSCSAVNELIQDGKTGILCDDGANALSMGIVRLMKNPKMRKMYGSAGKALAKHYCENEILVKWRNIINEIY